MTAALGTRHPTLTFSDLAARRRHRLRAHHAPHRVYLAFNSRGALFRLLASLPAEAGDTILVPAFHCLALVKPITAAGYRLGFYRVRPDLTIDVADLAARLAPGVAAVVAIHYFGFPADLDAVQQLVRARGAYLVEDCAHAFLSRVRGESIGRHGDFALYSYYKFAPSLVGGALVVNRGDLPIVPPRRLPLGAHLRIGKRLLGQLAANAPGAPLSRALVALQRRAARRAGNEGAGVSAPNPSGAAARPADARFLNDPYHFDERVGRAPMPWYARRIVEGADWERIADKRRANYRLLSGLLPDSERLRRLWPELPDGVVPWLYPVMLEQRIDHEQPLRELGIPFLRFGETLHPEIASASAAARRDAERLSRTLLLLPIHQRIERPQIEAYSEALLRYLEKRGREKGAEPFSR